MIRREQKARRYASTPRTLNIGVDMRRLKVSRNGDERRLNQTVRSVSCRRMMNFDAVIRDCAR